MYVPKIIPAYRPRDAPTAIDLGLAPKARDAVPRSVPAATP